MRRRMQVVCLRARIGSLPFRSDLAKRKRSIGIAELLLPSSGT